MLCKERFRLFKVLLVEELGVTTVKETAAMKFPDVVVDIVTDERGDNDHRHKDSDIERLIRTRRNRGDCEEKRVTGKPWEDDNTCFNENDAKDRGIGKRTSGGKP